MSGRPGAPFQFSRYPGYPASRSADRSVRSGFVSLARFAFITARTVGDDGGGFGSCSPGIGPVSVSYASHTVAMRATIESHQYAETVLQGQFSHEWEQLLGVLGTLDVPLRPVGPYTRTGRPKSPKRQFRVIGGRKASALMPVDQAQMNGLIRGALSDLGWNPEPYILIDREGRPIDTRLRGDFEKSGVFVEVEFGNVASFYRDLFKFHIAGTTGAAHVGVIVVATDSLARFFDQGQARFEQAVSMLPYMRAGVQLPTAIIGIDVSDWAPIRRRYDEMRQLVEENGEACHPFDAVAAN